MFTHKTDSYTIITFIIFCYISKAYFTNAFASPAESVEKTNNNNYKSGFELLISPTGSFKSKPILQFSHNEDGIITGKRKKRQLNIIQSKIVDLTNPQPIVDTITEDEKYGNTVEHTFGRIIVKAVENISNVINSLFAFPINTVKKASRGVTDALNQIGGKIVGLQ